MKESIYKSYEELPLFLNAEMVGKLLGISPSSSYELMHEDGYMIPVKASQRASRFSPHQSGNSNFFFSSK